MGNHWVLRKTTGLGKMEKNRQGDLFEWAENRPCAEIISIIPYVAAQIRHDLRMGIIDNPPKRDGALIKLPPPKMAVR